jgi:anti-sigma-K factor RskA
MTSDLCRGDAAYVLGALSPSDRRIFEEHLADCTTCQRSLPQLAGLPGLLSKVSPGDFDSVDEPPPATLLPRLIADVRRERTRRRRFSTGLAAAAAVAAIVVGLAARDVSHPPHLPAGGVAMTHVAESAINARARLSNEPWGTQIQLLCRYDNTSPYRRSLQRSYSLVVTDRAGRTRQVATWNVVRHGTSTVTGSIGWSEGDIAKVEIRTPTGTPVLRLTT